LLQLQVNPIPAEIVVWLSKDPIPASSHASF